MKKLDLRAHAKLNLSIDVLGTRQDGYHEVAMVMQQISLHDMLCVKWLPGEYSGGQEGIAIETGSNKKFLPSDRRNLTYKAAELIAGEYDICSKKGPGKVRIDIKKQIPVGAGLGGGSSDAAAVLYALSEIWELSLSLDELCALGARIGSDVPFCIMGQAGKKCALAEGTGTALTAIDGAEFWVVLAKPPISVSTPEVYKGFDLIEDTGFEKPDTRALTDALKAKDYPDIGKNMINVLEKYTLRAYPSVMQTKDRMLETSPFKALMSGSGPTVAGFYRSEEEASAAYEKIAPFYKETFLTKTLI
jgi:4-diphosphocytidyl-2-C-methyl-D-erythritol kinase